MTSSIPATTAPNPQAATQPGSTSSQAASFAGGDFQTFLKMLTTQIKHQDPLNPMEGSDFAVQLATFSGVEQQVRTNQILEQLAGTQAGGLAALADWIGKEIRTTAPVAFDGTPITLDIRPDPGADRVELVTLDTRGRELLRENIGLGSGEVDWAGRTDNGLLPDGIYSFQLISYRGDEILSSGAVAAFTRVTGAELTREGARLSLHGGASALETQVTALREAR
ncbi:flagellar hook capping FlgD N-terminal domain-containing protein [Paracoccus alkenifer]|uniref:Basal-body rod modification protein FlgD n=1 Tax=Paracoccus alkenifer TaxID=65735 RepID=A0A1H6K0T0_9RHOB|nr:flagellar hook capping FlgD N-terminal domain-containing protein [Paracoccus alkenifer]SEH65175.1 flagellar basal-body rod modification protein FlgD [Paracoccus alkenifer]